MVALTATVWTETVEERNIHQKKKFARVKLSLPVTGAAFYPSSGGIPLPTTMGMVRNIDYVTIITPLGPTTVAAGPQNNFMQTYDKENHSLHIYERPVSTAAAATGMVEAPTTWTASNAYGTSPVMYVEAVGW